MPSKQKQKRHGSRSSALRPYLSHTPGAHYRHGTMKEQRRRAAQESCPRPHLLRPSHSHDIVYTTERDPRVFSPILTTFSEHGGSGRPGGLLGDFACPACDRLVRHEGQ